MRRWLIGSAIALAGCGAAQVAAPSDAGHLADAAPSIDASAPADAAAPFDALAATDARALDAARSPLEAGADALPPDGGPPALHDCRTFVDRSAAGADRTVRFDSSPSLAYEPSCIRVAPGQTVVFEGPLERHPLEPGRAPDRPHEPDGSADNPIPRTTSGVRVEVELPSSGSFPFHCPVHTAAAMVGVVLVE